MKSHPNSLYQHVHEKNEKTHTPGCKTHGKNVSWEPNPPNEQVSLWEFRITLVGTAGVNRQKASLVETLFPQREACASSFYTCPNEKSRILED